MLSENTEIAYRSCWRLFQAWCSEQRRKSLPASPDTVAKYLANTPGVGSSKGKAVSAIIRAHNAAGHPSPVDAHVREVLRSVRRRSPRPRQAAGATWEQADAAAELASTDGLVGLRDAAVLAVMSDGLLRVSEAAALDIEDLEGEAPCTLSIRRSKTDQVGEGAVLPIRQSTVDRCRAWLAAAKMEMGTGPLFTTLIIHRSAQDRLGTQGIRQLVKRRLRAAGMTGKVSGHSLRVGSAQSLVEKGASLPELQIAGRWESPKMPGQYARGLLASGGAVRKYRGE